MLAIDKVFELPGWFKLATLSLLLLEYKSSRDLQYLFQLLDYVNRIWLTHMKEFGLSKENPFPRVMTALLYTGKERWDLEKTSEWLEVPEWFKKNFREQIIVIDLWRHDLSKKRLDNPEVKAAVYVMGQDDLDLAAECLAVLNPATAFCKTLVEFAVKVLNKDIVKFREFLSKYGNKEMEILAGSMGDQCRTKGRTEGITIGRTEGRAEGITVGRVQGRME